MLNFYLLFVWLITSWVFVLITSLWQPSRHHLLCQAEQYLVQYRTSNSQGTRQQMLA